MTKRRYTLRRRAEQQERTRSRIVEAAMALHEEVGPKETTISAVAGRAGVQRLTVYRHFPDDESLFQACTSHWIELNPPPDPAEWRALTDPGARGRAALTAIYAYYRSTERMWERSYRDVREVPALQPPMEGFERYLRGVRDDLLASWHGAGATDHALDVTLGHCLRFSTWQSLAREGLDDPAMAGLAGQWIAGILDRTRR